MNDEARSQPGFVVLRKVADGHWELVGEARRRPGRTARAARREAIIEAIGGEPAEHDEYAVILRSEWRIGLDH
jgi:hypothetical protein